MGPKRYTATPMGIFSFLFSIIWVSSTRLAVDDDVKRGTALLHNRTGIGLLIGHVPYLVYGG